MRRIKIRFQALINKEFLQLMRLTVGILDANDPVKNKFKEERDALLAEVDKLSKALDFELSSELTEQIQAADSRRDKAIVGFTQFISSYCSFPDGAKAEAAEKVKRFIKSLGDDLYSLNYQAETSTLNKLIETLKTDKDLKASLAKISPDTLIWLTEIETSNNLFESIYQKRSSEISLQEEVESFYNLRPRAIAAFDAVFDTLVAMKINFKKEKKDTTQLDKAINDINSTIKQYKQLIKSTQKRNKEENNTGSDKSSEVKK